MSVLWDGLILGSDYQIYYVTTTNYLTQPIFFSFDLGVTVELSRFRMWGRALWVFNLHHPKELEIWGCNDPNVANGDPCSWDGWELLLSCTSTKPSGETVLPNASLTPEDVQLTKDGEEFVFPDKPIARYIRVKVVRSWTNSQMMHIGELTFWGDDRINK
jgi:hypothetical protein